MEQRVATTCSSSNKQPQKPVDKQEKARFPTRLFYIKGQNYK